MIKKILYSNTSWSLISNGATAFLGFVNLALVARLYTKDDAGKWFMLLTVYTLLDLLRNGMVQTPFVRYFTVANDDAQRSKLIAASWQLMLVITLLAAAVALPFAWFFRSGQSAFSLVKTHLPLWLLAALPYQLLQWQLQGRMLFKKLGLIRLVFPVTFAVLLVTGAHYKFNINLMAVSYAVLQLMAGVTGLLLGWLKLGNWIKPVGVERKLLLGFGKYSMFTMVAAGLLRSSDQFMIAAWLGPAAVATYSIPQKLIEAIEIPVRSFAVIAMPRATQLWEQLKFAELRTYFYKECGLLTVMILPLLLTFFCFPGFIVGLIGGSKYQGSSILLQIFCFYAALIPLDRYCGVLLDAGNQPRKNTIKVVGMLVVNLFFDWLALTTGAGLFGVAAGSTITFLFGIIAGWIQLKDVLQGFKAKLLWKEGMRQPLQVINHYLPAKA